MKMRSGRSETLLNNIRDELAKLKREVDLIELKCVDKALIRTQSSPSSGGKSNSKPGKPGPTVHLIAHGGHHRSGSIHYVPSGNPVVIPRSRIPRCSLPSRPCSAAAALPIRDHGEWKAAAKERTRPGTSANARSKNFPVGGSINEPRTLHSSVSSLVSISSGSMPPKSSKPRQQDSAIKGQYSDEVGNSTEGVRSPGCCLLTSKIPHFSRGKSPKPSKGHWLKGALSRTVHKAEDFTYTEAAVLLSNPKSDAEGRTTPKMSFPMVPNSTQKRISTAVGPSPQRSLPGFDVGKL